MKVLVPVDGSEAALRAAKHALEAAKAHANLEVTLLAVACQVDFNHFTEFSDWNEYLRQTASCKELYAAGLAAAKRLFDEAGVPVQTELLVGDPGGLIAAYAEAKGMDRVIMGSRGLSPLKGAILGSVAYKVLSSVKMPVIIVK